jgi:peptidoglycan hydrolase CwlO-like protein
LKNQVVSFQNELDHLVSIEQKYQNENRDLSQCIESESRRNIELTMNIKDLEGRIRVREDTVAHIRRDMEGAHYSN